MKRWKFRGIRPSIGLMIDQHEIAMSVTVFTARGRREVARETRSCENLAPEEVVARMLEPWVDASGASRAKPKPWVRIGLPEARIFQAALPINAANRQQSAQNFFLEAVQATNVRAEDRIVELVKLQLENRSLACVAAAPRSVIESLIEMLSKLRTRVGLIESAPTSLCRAGEYYRKTPRGSKLCVRFFLGESQAIGVAAARQQPLFWHTFDLTPGDETAAILAAYSTLWMMGRHARITIPIDTVVIHGRPELALSEQQQHAFGTRSGARLLRCDRPSFDGSAAALGLSLANPLTDELGLDLARTLKPQVTIRDIFPFGELVAHCALMCAVSLFLVCVAAESSHRLRAVTGALKAFPWLSNQDQGKLDGEKRTIQDRLKAVNTFRDSRVTWSALLRTIAATVPESTLITTVTGEGEIEADARAGPAKAKKKLVVGFETPLAGNGSLPHEIDGFLATLRSDKTLKRHFPLIEVTGYRANPARQGEQPSASYSIVCLPNSDKNKKPPAR
jgi:hypothetical protein